MENANINTNQLLRSADTGWTFLAECSLSQLLFDDFGDDLIAGLGMVAFRELGITTECLHRMKTRLVTTTQGRHNHLSPGRTKVSMKIRVFCEKKVTQKGYPDKTSTLPDAVQMGEHDGRVDYPKVQENGGWGYFLVERNETALTGSSDTSWDCVELYLYREGK